MPGKNERFHQRNKVEDQSQPDRRLHHLRQQVSSLAEQQDGVHQPDAIKSDRDSKPDKRHNPNELTGWRPVALS
jgi:hypothetical protein